MEGHNSYINHLVFEPTEGKQIASVSDDHTCRCVCVVCVGESALMGAAFFLGFLLIGQMWKPNYGRWDGDFPFLGWDKLSVAPAP